MNSMEPTTARYAATLSRAMWPDPLFAPDLAAVFGMTPEGAVRLVRREGIPFLRIGRRVAVRARSLARWMDDAEVDPQADATPPGPCALGGRP